MYEKIVQVIFQLVINPDMIEIVLVIVTEGAEVIQDKDEVIEAVAEEMTEMNELERAEKEKENGIETENDQEDQAQEMQKMIDLVVVMIAEIVMTVIQNHAMMML